MPEKNNKIIVSKRDMNFIDNLHSDCGGCGLEWVCPDCGVSVRWAPFAWWDLECSCRTWELEMRAKGVKR